MMKRLTSVVALTALLVVMLPLGSVAAHGNGDGNGDGHRGGPGKIVVCHKTHGAHPVTITISNAAWKAHERHGDTKGACQGTTKPAKPTNPATSDVCTFDATTSAYYTGLTPAPAQLFATGPIHFSWTVSTGVVSGSGGFWDEIIGGTTYHNNVTSGSVSGTGAVSLSFQITTPIVDTFSFSGNLVGNTLSGQMDGPNWFTATGTKTCQGAQTGPTVCTFSAANSAYYNGLAATPAQLYGTGPIHFSWNSATGVVVTPGGSWNELVGGTTYFNNVNSGTVTGAGAVTLSFVRTVPDSRSFSFSGNLVGNTLSGQADGANLLTATGTTTCGTGQQNRHGNQGDNDDNDDNND